MKKFLTLFLLMLTAMGASAQITSLDELSTEKTYTLRMPCIMPPRAPPQCGLQA